MEGRLAGRKWRLEMGINRDTGNWICDALFELVQILSASNYSSCLIVGIFTPLHAGIHLMLMLFRSFLASIRWQYLERYTLLVLVCVDMNTNVR